MNNTYIERWFCHMNKNFCSNYTLRISKMLLYKMSYISKFEGRSVNKQIEYVIRQHISEFEKNINPIPLNDKNLI